MFCTWWSASTSVLSSFMKTISSSVIAVDTVPHRELWVSRSKSTGVRRYCKLVPPRWGSCQISELHAAEDVGDHVSTSVPSPHFAWGDGRNHTQMFDGIRLRSATTDTCNILPFSIWAPEVVDRQLRPCGEGHGLATPMCHTDSRIGSGTIPERRQLVTTTTRSRLYSGG